MFQGDECSGVWVFQGDGSSRGDECSSGVGVPGDGCSRWMCSRGMSVLGDGYLGRWEFLIPN